MELRSIFYYNFVESAKKTLRVRIHKKILIRFIKYKFGYIWYVGFMCFDNFVKDILHLLLLTRNMKILENNLRISFSTLKYVWTKKKMDKCLCRRFITNSFNFFLVSLSFKYAVISSKIKQLLPSSRLLST